MGAGGQPGRAVFGEATARNEVGEVRGGLAWPAPGVPDPGAPWEGGAEATLVLGQTLASRGRRLQQGLGPEARRRAAAGSACLGDGAGEEDVRPGQLLVQVGCEPRRGLMLLALGTVAVAAGMLDAVLSGTGWARREALAIGTATAVLDGAEPLTV